MRFPVLRAINFSKYNKISTDMFGGSYLEELYLEKDRNFVHILHIAEFVTLIIWLLIGHKCVGAPMILIPHVIVEQASDLQPDLED